jgi:hypothetical protein
LRNLAELFSLDEIALLAFEVGASGDVSGDTVIQRAASLTEWAERNNKLVLLTVAIAKARPDAKWD